MIVYVSLFRFFIITSMWRPLPVALRDGLIYWPAWQHTLYYSFTMIETFKKNKFLLNVHCLAQNKQRNVVNSTWFAHYRLETFVGAIGTKVWRGEERKTGICPSVIRDGCRSVYIMTALVNQFLWSLWWPFSLQWLPWRFVSYHTEAPWKNWLRVEKGISRILGTWDTAWPGKKMKHINT